MRNRLIECIVIIIPGSADQEQSKSGVGKTVRTGRIPAISVMMAKVRAWSGAGIPRTPASAEPTGNAPCPY